MIKRFTIAIGIVLGALLLPYMAFGLIATPVNQGGTGSTTLSGVLIGNGTSMVNTLTIGSNLTLTGTTLSASGSGGSGTVSTSTNETSGSLAYWTSNSATPALLGKTATGTIGVSGGITATANQFIIGSGLTIGCTAASAGATGCLSNTDWSTFNNKQATIGVTWPITLSGATIAFNGLSTSSAAVQGNIPYFSGVNTFANVATSSETCTSPVTCSSFSIIGTGGAITLGTVPIASGGTNATTFSANTIIGFDGTRLIATGTPQLTIGNLLGTSTATSSLAGAFKISTTSTTAFNITDQYNSLYFNVYTASTTGNILDVASSTNQTLVSVSQAGFLGVGSSTPYEPLVSSTTELSGGTHDLILDTSAQAFSAGGPIIDLAHGGKIAVSIQGSLGASLTNPYISFTTPTGSNFTGGFGTSTPYANLSVQSNTGTGDIFALATTTGKMIAGEDNDGHKFTGGPAPALTSCGTGSPTITGDDQTGTVTTGTAATSCTMTFSKAYRATPVCNFNDDSSTIPGDISSISTTNVVFALGAGLSGGHLYYSCSYHRN